MNDTRTRKFWLELIQNEQTKQQQQQQQKKTIESNCNENLVHTNTGCLCVCMVVLIYFVVVHFWIPNEAFILTTTNQCLGGENICIDDYVIII